MKPSHPPLQIGNPCPKRWEDLKGNASRRFCEDCQLHVHNLSAMSNGERARFVAESQSQGHACIAYELRSDGSMVTPPHWIWLRQPLQRVRWLGSTLLAVLLPFLFSACATRRTLGRYQKVQCKTGDSSEGQILLGTPALPSDSDSRK